MINVNKNLLTIIKILISMGLFIFPLVSAAFNIDFINRNTTWEEIQQRLSKDYQLVWTPRYLEGYGAIEVREKGHALFSLITNSKQTPSANTTFSTLIIESPRIKTAEGIGPGSLISDAVKEYGSATLNYNPENESREFVAFDNGPENTFFRTGSVDTAGIYEQGSYTTTRYKKDGKIKSLIVSL